MGGTVGERLAELRQARRWTQPEVAKRLGLTRVSVSNHERDTTMPDEPTLRRYADLYGVGVEALRYGTSDANAPLTPNGPNTLGEPGAGQTLEFWRGYSFALLGVMETIAGLQRQAIGMQRQLVQHTDPMPKREAVIVPPELVPEVKRPPTATRRGRPANGAG
jgi:transcriptional regulator with XRE-family HTH domain